MRIVGSMTTIPSRILSIEKVIDSLLSQTRPLDCLYLHIPIKTLKGESYTIPDFLKHKKLILNRCDKDYGPITKLVPVLDLEKDNNTYIITFDDDRIVQKDVVKIIEKKINKYPDCALSFSGWNVGSFPFYLECHENNEEDLEVDWIQGCHSITYPRKILSKKILNPFFTAPICLHRHDDHKISAFLSRNNIKKISIGKDAQKYFLSAPQCMTDAISGGYDYLRMVEYFCEVYYIVNYFQTLGLYKQTYTHFYKTKTFKILFVMVCIGVIISYQKFYILFEKTF